MKVVKGHMLCEKDGKSAAIINEAAVKGLGWSQPIGKKIKISSEEEYTIVGVIKDIYYNAPSIPVTPAIYTLQTNEDYVNNNILFKVKEGTWDTVCQRLNEEVRRCNPNAEIRVLNMEEVYNEYMKSEATLSRLLTIVSFVCIAIAVFGIFSLVALSCEQRRKEIAIRKVNGASVRSILISFFKEYLLLLVIASALAFPLGYVVMKQWLEGYMKQTPITFWIYAAIFIMVALVLFLSIIWRIWKVARQNPSVVIKFE